MTATTSVKLSTGAYTLLTSGLANVLVQGPERTPFEVVVAQSLPPATQGGLVIDDNTGFAISFAALGASDNVYARAINPGATGVVVVA